jgi:hypothetical protein
MVFAAVGDRVSSITGVRPRVGQPPLGLRTEDPMYAAIRQGKARLGKAEELT